MLTKKQINDLEDACNYALDRAKDNYDMAVFLHRKNKFDLSYRLSIEYIRSQYYLGVHYSLLHLLTSDNIRAVNFFVKYPEQLFEDDWQSYDDHCGD